jgi:hypothetical protein
VLFGGDSELVVESVVPNFLHIVPISYNTMFDGLLHAEHTTLLLSFTSYIDLLLVETNHDTRDLWPSYYGTKDRARSIVSCETSLAHSRAIINNDSRYFLVHFQLVF